MPFVGRMGFGEIILVLVVLLIVFGPRRLPELGGALGKGIREFKRSVSDLKSGLNSEEELPANQFNKPISRVAGAVAAGESVIKSAAPQHAEGTTTEA
jgi:sec-independent protein translocase protein TatA